MMSLRLCDGFKVEAGNGSASPHAARGAQNSHEVEISTEIVGEIVLTPSLSSGQLGGAAR